MGGRREVSIIFYRPVTRSDLKQERLFFRGSVSSLLQLVVVRHTGNTYKRKDKYIFSNKMNQNTFGGLKKLARRFK